MSSAAEGAGFDAGWLALREPFDAASRSLELAARISAALPARPRITDLGAGTGALLRWLAPLIGRAQAWTLVDDDPELLDEAFAACAGWAEARGYPVTWPGDAMLIHAPGGAWRVEAIAADIAAAPEIALRPHADLVACSALLDLVSAPWLERLAGGLRVPFYAALSVDGRDVWLPRHPADALIAAGFRRDQARDKGFGPALGRRAPAAAQRILAAHRFELRGAVTDWRISGASLAMLRAMVEGTAAAASAAMPARRETVAGWMEARLRQAMAGRLAIRIGHRDILALPRKD